MTKLTNDREPQHILVIEDDPDILELFDYNLKKSGYLTTLIANGQTGLDYALTYSESIDLILLDLMLPGLGGLDVCRNIRKHDKAASLPIIMVTARGEENDIVLGLELGADDYVVKPFSPKEIIARVKSCLRRADLKASTQQSPHSDTIKIGPIQINTESFEVHIDDKSQAFTLSEFKLLKTMMQNPDKVFTRSQLLTIITGEGTHIVDRNVDVHIRALRKKMGSCAELIETVRGIGYKFVTRSI